MVQQRFQIIVLRKLCELQENTDNSSQSGKTHEQNEKFNKEKLLKKNLREELKNIVKWKFTSKECQNRFDQVEERIHELKGKSFKIMHQRFPVEKKKR